MKAWVGMGLAAWLCAAWANGAWAQDPASAPAAVIYAKDKPPATPKLEALPLKDSVSQYGITWRFDKQARVGQFVNGDWYVVGPVTIRMIDPKPLFGEEVKDAIGNKGEMFEGDVGGRYARNGSTLDPRCDTKNAAG